MNMDKPLSDKIKFCTRCNRCLPCPARINIPDMMEVVHLEKHLDKPQSACQLYRQLVSPENENVSSSPSACYRCGACELKCPEKIKVITELKYLSEKYEPPCDKKNGQQ